MIHCTDGPDILEYDPSQSHLVGFTVPNPSPKADPLPFINDDLGLVTNALEKKNALARNASRLFPGSLCTYKNIQEIFMEEAERVKNNGAFIALFNGHGIPNCGFVPQNDDNNTEDTLIITARVLTEWLRSNENICPKFVLLIINCCYAGGLAQRLFEGSELPSYTVYVISSTEPLEKSWSVRALGHSLFYYFLTHAIKTTVITSDSSPKVQLPIKSIFDECHKLCSALCSLLYGETMTPMFMRTNNQSHGFSPETANIAFDPTNYYENTQGEHFVLSQRCKSWIKSCTEVDGGGLSELSDKGVLKEKRVLNTVLCFMLYSAITIHLEDKIEKATLASWDYFITVFICIKDAISERCSEAIIDKQGFCSGLHDYIAILQNTTCDTRKLWEFYKGL